MSAFDDILNEADDEEVTPPGDESTATAGDEADDAETEVQAPVAETAAEEPTTEAVATEGYKQDARGVWHRPDGTIASKDEVAGLTPEAVADPPPPEAVPEAPAAAEAPPTPAVPFRYRAAQQTHELPGATFVDGKLMAEGEGLSTIRQALNSHTVLPQYMSRVAELERELQTRGPAESKASKLVEALSAIIENPDEEAAITEFFTLRQNFPAMKSQAEVEYWKSQASRGQAAPQRQEQHHQSALPAPDVALSTTQEYVEQFKLEAEFRSMTDADWQQIGESISRTPYAFIRPAGQKDAEQYGVAVGELVFDTDALAAHIQSHQSKAQAAREAEAAARKAKEAARFNQQQTPKAPAKPAPKRASPPTVTVGSNKPKDWESSFKSAWTDSDDDDDMN